VVGAANTEAQTTAPALLEDGATKTDGSRKELGNAVVDSSVRKGYLFKSSASFNLSCSHTYYQFYLQL
jgi:hypothetical protein